MSDIPIAINYHLNKHCNLRCKFCFATFRDVPGALDVHDARALLTRLREAGGEKINFAGGEPTLFPHLALLIEHAKALGFTTSIVTNGARLRPLLERHAEALDWVGLSVDSSHEEVQAALGRGRGQHVAKSIAHADHAHAVGVRVKLNTVVTALTWDEDMSDLVRRMKPARWKVFQVLPVAGQNDGDVDQLLIPATAFEAFLERHRPLAAEGVPPVAEDNQAMRGSYVMVDPLGRFYSSLTGRHEYSEPILQVGVAQALRQIGFSMAKLRARGGLYRWER
ncbi:viperin family antiviral radical SAM protein [Haliangium sp.]|uniref:viperin family antiviral radical SAM protein n=1 Tax=Haliangium sp. TaxID=2663208 RepID=UPI003D13D596